MFMTCIFIQGTEPDQEVYHRHLCAAAIPLGEVGNAAQITFAHRLALFGGFDGLLQRPVHLKELAQGSQVFHLRACHMNSIGVVQH